MKTIFSIILFFLTFVCSAQTSISTEHGIKNIENNNSIIFNFNEWNLIMAGTELEFEDPGPHIRITVCMRIASRNKGCKSGAGFRCGFVKCNSASDAKGNGQKEDRTYYFEIISSGDGKIHLNPLEPIDWQWLEK